jgi:MSHA biogenesis protein MshM
LSLAFCLPPPSAPWQTWRQITDRLAELELESRHAVLLLDDLDRAAPSGLLAVERLLALDAAPLTIAASARPESAGRLGPRIIEHAALRIDLAPWNEDETSEYLNRRAPAGANKPSYDKAAARRLFYLSGGAPRKVNQLALLAEIASAGQSLPTIDENTVIAVHEELTAAR